MIQYDPPHPGEILSDFYLGPLGLDERYSAKQLSINPRVLSLILAGKEGISRQIAIKLAEAFNTTTDYWQNLQNAYDRFNNKD